MPEHDPRDPKVTPPARGPVPDPHRDEPAPRPDAHTRPAPDADVIRPDQDEELGPVEGLFKASAAEAAAEVTGSPEAEAEAIRQGAEAEGVEAAQIFSLMLATLVALALAVVGVVFLVNNFAGAQAERRAGEASYPERRELQARATDRLGNYAVDEEGAFRIPIEAAMEQVAAAYFQQQGGGVPAPAHFSTAASYRSATPATVAGEAAATSDTLRAGAAGAQGAVAPAQAPPTQTAPAQSAPVQNEPEEQ